MNQTGVRRALAAVAVLAVVLTGCNDEPDEIDPTATPTEGQLILKFDDGGLTNSGSGDFDIDVVALDNGSTGADEALDGDALRTPEFADSPDGPKAIVKVLNASDSDELNPGDKDFTIGADINVDPSSESEDDASHDNGNNVMQRGLFEGSQYKIQIDHDTASCRIAGSEGEVTAKSSTTIEAGHWYRIRCARSGDDVTITVIDQEADDPEPTEDEDSGSIGSLDPTSASLPLSVGGKLNADGGIVKDNTDQFNGLIDNVLLDIN